MNSNATVHVGVSSAEEEMARVVERWNRAERGEVMEPEVRLMFSDFETMLRVLTPKRMTLLRTLRQEGAMSVRALSIRLERDYKRVHTEVAALENEGLITRTEEGLIEVPWDEIDARYSLVA